MIKLYEMQRITKSQEARDAYGYAITKIHSIIHFEE